MSDANTEAARLEKVRTNEWLRALVAKFPDFSSLRCAAQRDTWFDKFNFLVSECLRIAREEGDAPSSPAQEPAAQTEAVVERSVALMASGPQDAPLFAALLREAVKYEHLADARWKACAVLDEAACLWLADVLSQPAETARADAAEARLAEIEAQEPVAYEVRFNGRHSHYSPASQKDAILPQRNSSRELVPLYARPGPAGSEREAEAVEWKISLSDEPGDNGLMCVGTSRGVGGWLGERNVGFHDLRALLGPDTEATLRVTKVKP